MGSHLKIDLPTRSTHLIFNPTIRNYCLIMKGYSLIFLLSYCGIALISAQEWKDERVPVLKQIVTLNKKLKILEVYSIGIDNKIEKLGLSLDEKIELLMKLQHEYKKQNENEIELLKNALSIKQAAIDELKMNY